MIVTVDSALRFDDSGLPPEFLAQIAHELWMYNPNDPSEQIHLVNRLETDEAVLPRGYALRLRKLAELYGVPIEWDDQRVKFPALIHRPTDFVEPRAYQMRAIERMAAAEQGIYEAATASGKTITAALLTSELMQRTIVVVDKINLATQWQDRFEQALGMTPAIIGESDWKEDRITIATRQALWARREVLDAHDWWSTWGMLIVDECHAISAETVRELFQRFPAYYRFGITATPDRHDWIMAASRGIIGEIVCRTTETELQEAGVLLKPKVVAVRTPFIHKPTKGVSSNVAWNLLLNEMKVSPGRNALITEILRREVGQTMLVQTDHTSHAEVLIGLATDAGWSPDRVFLMTGKQSGAERDRIRHESENGNMLIVSTIGKEALDIPRLNRYMIAFPTRNKTATIQMVGRIKRTHAEKGEAIVYDIYDHRVPRLTTQFQSRREVYARQGLDLKFEGDPAILPPALARG